MNDRRAADVAALVRADLHRLRGDLAETVYRTGLAGLLLAAAGGYLLTGLDAASATTVRLLEAVLPRRLAAAGLTAGYLGVTAGLRRLRAATCRSGRLG